MKCEVWIAASGDQKALLQKEFPFLRFVELPGYEVKYGKNRASTLLKIFSSIPKILIRIKQEKEWLRRFCATEKPDAVISDNRYGLHTPGLYSVLITHQLRIRTPFGSWADTLLQQIHYRAIRQFSLCWIPDLEGAHSLAGNLSHPEKLPVIPTRYIGLLSRFERPGLPETGAVESMAGTREPSVEAAEPSGEMTERFDATPERSDETTERSDETPERSDETPELLAEAPVLPCDLLILLSGPEPQRTIFERKVLDQLATYSGSAILVRGLPGAGLKPGIGSDGGGKGDRELPMPVTPGVRVYNHLPASALNRVINEAGIVLARAGYSTIMDLLILGKKAILVPTPGQTEQEYLGNYLSGKGIALCRAQARFSLAEALSGARTFPFAGIGEKEAAGIRKKGRAAGTAGSISPAGEDLLQNALRSFLRSLANPSQDSFTS